MRVTNAQELTKRIEQLREAQKQFATFSQEQVDEIFRQAALAANHNRIKLAKMAVEETGMGIVEDKVIKNNFAAEYIYNQYKNMKTCGVLEEDKTSGITKVAEPIGVISAIVPTTNPTSTAIFKCLIALKTRNAIIISPHPRAKNSTIEAAKIVLEAAVKAGAPEGIIGWIDQPSVELSQNVMRESDIILATGGPAMVKAAYSSGRPALGVGAGNTPAIIDESAHIKMAVNSILLGGYLRIPFTLLYIALIAFFVFVLSAINNKLINLSTAQKSVIITISLSGLFMAHYLLIIITQLSQNNLHNYFIEQQIDTSVRNFIRKVFLNFGHFFSNIPSLGNQPQTFGEQTF